MAIKKTGISPELIIHPGETIKDVIDGRGISQAELAEATGMSAAYVSQVINGKKGISAQFAMALEYALDVPKSFWLNLQAHYEAEKLEADEASTVTEEERKTKLAISDTIEELKSKNIIQSEDSSEEIILILRRIFHTSNISNLNGFGYNDLPNYMAVARARMMKAGIMVQVGDKYVKWRSFKVPTVLE